MNVRILKIILYTNITGLSRQQLFDKLGCSEDIIPPMWARISNKICVFCLQPADWGGIQSVSDHDMQHHWSLVGCISHPSRLGSDVAGKKCLRYFHVS